MTGEADAGAARPGDLSARAGDGASGPRQARTASNGADPAVGRLAVALFAALAVASIAAFFVAQRLKHTPTAVQQLKIDPSFYPEGGGVPRLEALSFELERADVVTVEVVGSSGQTVATLARRLPMRAYTTGTFRWNGREGSAPAGGQPRGAPAPRGEYKVRLLLSRARLELHSPTPFLLFRDGRA